MKGKDDVGAIKAWCEAVLDNSGGWNSWIGEEIHISWVSEDVKLEHNDEQRQHEPETR